jgi:hypothetical protein
MARPSLKLDKLHLTRKTILAMQHSSIWTDKRSDPANFINFCTGKTLTNGLQVKTGSCNGIGTLQSISHALHRY